MTLFQSIVVLEDTLDRVQWLRATFPGVEIVHCTNVVDFIVHTRRPHALVILDHDLAGALGDGPAAKAAYDAGADAYGLTGMDAVRVCDLDTPVVVWSANPVWGPRMADALVARGVAYVAQCPFFSVDDGRLANAIREAYFSSTGVWLWGRQKIKGFL